MRQIEEHGGALPMDKGTGEEEALLMLETFASAAATFFDLTVNDLYGKLAPFRDTDGKTFKGYKGGQTLADLRSLLPSLMKSATLAQHNIIVRPRGLAVTFLQLDDLKPESIERMKPVSLLQLATSPGNYQAWIAMHGAEDKDFASRLRAGVPADPTASGATRIAGHPNFKTKYDPTKPENNSPEFPRVTMIHSSPGLFTSKDELNALGVVAPAATYRTLVKPVLRRPGVKKWPSYETCLQEAPLNNAGTGPDVSRADIVWCMMAIDRGWSIEDTAARLMEESSKAHDNANYAQLTAEKAALYVGQRQQRRRG